MVHFTTCDFASSSVEVTEICNVNLCQIISTSVVCCLLIIGIFFLAFRYKKRCFTTLLYLHNYRSAVELLLFAWGSMDLAASCLPLDPQLYVRRTSGYIAAPFGVFNSILTIVVTIILAIYHRIAEIKYKPESLYFSIAMELYLSGVQVYKIPRVMHNHDITDLRPFFGMSLALLFTILAILDAATIYKEHLKPKEVETKLPQDEAKIGYSHSTATFISKVLFWWMTPLFWRGYKEPLEPEDLGSLREEDSTKIYYDQFLFIYKTTKWNNKPSLWLCYLKSSWKQFTLGGIFKLLGDLSALVGPLSICQIVEYIEQQYENHQDQQRQQMGNNLTTIIRQEHAWDQSDRNLPVTQDTKIYYPNWNELLSNGWIIAWIVLLASIVQGGLSQASTHLVNMIGIRIKTSLQGLIYRKTLLLSSSFLYNPEVIIDEEQAQIKGHVLKSSTAKATTSASNTTTKTTLSMTTTTTSIKDAGAITNLMSEDALNVMSFFWIAHYVWAIPLKIGVVMYLLYRKLGISAIIGSLVCIVTMTPLQFLIGKAMSNNSEKAAECTDERLKRTNDVFLGIKLIKLNAWEKVFGDKILASRRRELKFLNRDSIFWTFMTFLTHVSSVLITFVTLAVFIKLESDNSDINKAGYTNNIYNNNNSSNNNNNNNNSSISHSSSFINLAINRNATSHIIHDMEIEGEQKQHMEFTASRLFSALALFNQLTVPLFIFPITVPIIISAIVSTRRLERFLQEPEVQKHFEGIRNMARILSRSDASLDMYEEEEQNTVVGGDETTMETTTTMTTTTTTARKDPEQMSKRNSLIKPTDINLISPLVAHPNRKDLSPETSFAQKECSQRRSGGTIGGAGGGKELIRNSRIEKSRFRQKSLSSRDSIQFQSMENVVVSVQNSVFSWDKCNTLLKVDSLVVPKGKITIIVGKNGSGKTSLLAAFLKEMQQISGEVIWNKYATIAYVPQIPWLLNSSIRENILFGESFRPKRYEKVLEACALKPDIELMPGGDMTVIGERGINLSGGQKQRIVIARSLYSSANVIVMDDPLSSLDNEVAKHVFENSIKKMLLKANRTVVLVTQRLQLVHSADYIIAMKDGYVQSAGTYSDIDKENPGLILEWNSIIAKGSERGQMSPGKTARERWRLFKNVSKVGLQVNQNLDQEPIASTQSLYVPSKRRVSIFGSRHLTCDMPLPIDECQNEEIVFRRRGSQRARMCASLELRSDRKNVLRVNSLQPQSGNNVRTPVSRNISSPISLYSSKNRFAENDMKSKSSFRQFVNRMSSRRSNTALNARIHRTISASNSIKSITEESHMPVRRLMSDSSNGSDIIDDDSIEDLSDEDVQFSYDEERKYGEIATHVYMFYLKACSFSIVGIFFLSALIWQCLRVYTDAWLREWTDFEKSQDISYYFRIYSIISTVCIIVALISTPAGQLAGCRARRFLHEHLLHVILSKPLHFFQTTPLGRIINRFSNDMSIIDKKIAATSQRLLQFMLLCLCAVLINTSITPWFILLTIPICAAYYIIQKFYRCSSRELQRIESITSSPVISHFTETIQGVTTIRAYSQEARFTEILFKRLETNSVAFIVLNTSNRWLGIALDYLGGFIVFVAIITALVATTTINSSQQNAVELMEERTSPSLVGLAINYTLLVPIYLNWVVKLLADMEMYIGAVERVAYYGECDEVSETKEVIYKSVPISWPQRGDITFENVCLRYEGQTQNVIMDLSMKIPAGQRIGVCGRTGSGKSSLALSLFGVLKVVSGHIQIDDVDIAAVHPDEIRSRLSIIPQDVYLFNGTIRENLDPRGHYSDLDLWNCLEMAQLKDSVNALPRGLDTEIIDGGSNLSAGQRQLFCLARAVLRGSVCLVLDEATSSLDSITEIALLEAANKAFQGRTIITIAHRLSTLLDYDRIIVLDNGKIIEEGPPQELMLKSNGRFAAMLKTGNT